MTVDNKLKKLRDKWYKKIAKAGFKDIEDVDSPREMLKQWDSTWFTNRVGARFSEKTYTETTRNESTYDENPAAKKFAAIEEYYYKAEHFLNGYAFKNKKEQKYWEMHSKGISNHEISRKCRVSRKGINLIIKELKDIMLKWKSE